MGDGRYYTPEQFYNVILLTTLIVFVVIAFMLSLYKVENHKKYIRTLGGLLLTGLLFSFIYEIAYHRSVIVLSAYLKSIAQFGYILVSTALVVQNREDRNRSNQNFMLRSYGVFLLIPSFLIHPFHLETNLIYISYTAHFILVSNRFTKYKVSAGVFSDVKKLMLDYVFIVSAHGDVIFKNDKSASADIFKNMQQIDCDNISALFIDKATIRNAFSKQFIKLDAENTHYFQYQRKEILDKGKVVGFIMTFVDITNLIFMLDQLSEKREQTQKANLELDRYKDIVYDLEKEKEINALLDEIAKNQKKSMYVLKSRLEAFHIEEASFLEDLERISDKAKSDLSDVRAAVTSYIKYYE